MLEYVESSAFCKSILEARMSQGMLASGAVHPDITSYHCRGRAREAEALLGGFPCQAFQLHTKGQPLMLDCACAHI